MANDAPDYGTLSLDDLNAEQDRISAEIERLRDLARTVAEIRRSRIAEETARAKVGFHRLKPEEARALGLELRPEDRAAIGPPPIRVKAGVAEVGTKATSGKG